MKENQDKPADAADLRRIAEERLKAREQTPRSEFPVPRSDERLVHELQVHQIELEMQNEELKQARAEAAALLAQYTDLYDFAPMGYVTVGEKGLVLEANLTAATLLGVNRAALVKHPLTRFILKEDQDLFYLLRKRLAEGSGGQAHSLRTCELRMLKPDGSYFWAQVDATAAEGPDGAPACRVVLSDITERKKSEEALQESDLRFRHLLQHVPNVAVQGYGPDGTTLYWNEASERLYGYTAQEALGRNLVDLIIPLEMRGAVKQAVQQMAETGHQIPASELSLMRKDGSRVSVFSSHATVQIPGQPLALFCIDIDITDRKRAEESLKRIEWMLSKTPTPGGAGLGEDHDQGYGDLTDLNRDGMILKSIGLERLKGLAEDYLDLLGTSSAIYEANGDYAYGIFSSGWCRMIDCASRKLRATSNNAAALNSGRWLCHESCWMDCCKQVVARSAPVDIACHGGIRMYAVPIMAHGNVVGAMNFGYGDPPKTPEKLRMLAETYQLDYDDLVRAAHAYDSRPPFIIELAKKRLHTTARLIGAMIETKQSEEALKESEERLRLAHKATNDVVWDWDIVHDTQRWNESGVAAFGWTDIVERPQTAGWWVERVHPDDRQRVHESFFAVVANPAEDFWHDEYRFRKVDGSYADVLDRGYVLRNPQGKAVRMIGAMLDVSERKRAEAELARSTALLRDVVDLVPAYICAKNSEGRFLLVNRKLADFYGLPVDKMTGMLHADLCEDNEELRAMLAADREVIASGKSKVIPEETMKKPDGSLGVLETYKHPFTVNGEPAVLIAAADITARKRAEEAVRESEERFKAIANYAVSWESWFGPDGKYLWVNPAVEHLTGYSAEELLALPDFVSTVVAGEDRAVFIGRFREAIGGGRENDFEFRYLHKNGTKRWLSVSWQPIYDAQGTPLGTRSSGYDITARKQAEEALRESEQRHRDYLTHSPYGIFVADEQGRYVQVNPAACSITGYSEKELLSKSVADLHGEESREDAARHFQAVVREGKATGELKFTLKSGESRWWLVSAVKISDTRFLGFCNDITARKQAEESLRASQHLAESIIESIPGAFYLLDEAGKYVRWNAYQRDAIVGKPDDQIAGFPAIDTIHPDDRALIQARIANVLRSGTVETVEGRVLLRGGPKFQWLLMTGRQLVVAGHPYLVGIGIDITDRKERQQHIELLVRMLDEAPASITVHDTDGRFLFANRRTLELHGYADMESFLAVNLHALDVPESEARLAERFAAIERNGEASFEVAHYRADGSTFPLAVVARKIDWHGHPALLSIAADITERQKAEEALREQMEELQRWHKVTLGREVRVIELKREVNELVAKTGQPARYAAAVADGNGQI